MEALARCTDVRSSYCQIAAFRPTDVLQLVTEWLKYVECRSSSQLNPSCPLAVCSNRDLKIQDGSEDDGAPKDG